MGRAEESMRQLYRRSEIEVAADTLVALIYDGLLPMRPVTLRRAARATGVPMDTLRDALNQYERRGVRKPTNHVADPQVVVEAERHIERTAAGQMTSRATRVRDGTTRTQRITRPSQPTADTKRCPRCEKVKPLSEFAIKSHRTGQRKAYCRSCMINYQRQRYVKAKALGLWSAVQHRLELGEPFVGDECCDCGKAMVAGQVVEVGDIALRHVTCG